MTDQRTVATPWLNEREAAEYCKLHRGSLERLQELPRSPNWRVEHADMANPSDLRAVLERIRPRAILHVALDKAAYTDISEAERRRLFDAPRVVTYCGGGIAASGGAFVLTLLGHTNVAVYDGSLGEWAADPANPLVID